MLTWPQVRARRLAAHSLLARAPRDRLIEVVRATCGIHAQVMAAAELSIGIRVDVTRGDVRAALWNERTLVKAYGIRGTIHILPSDELPLWTAALRARSRSQEDKRLAALGLDRRKVDAIAQAIGEALDGGRLTLSVLGEEVARRAGSWAREGTVSAFGGRRATWRVGLGYAAAAGLVCFGPNDGTQVTYVRPDQWVSGWHDIDTGEALAEVFRRFLRAYGPATHRDFAQWSGVTPGFAGRLAATLADELDEVEVEGYRCLRLAAEASTDARLSGGPVRLLPHFDCYLRGFHPRGALVGDNAGRSAGGTGQVPVLLVDGAVSGVWERRSTGKHVLVRVDPFVSLGAKQHRELRAEAARIGEILGVESTLLIAPVTLRPHL